MTIDAQQQTAYRVLARKYRPSDFSELIGQDALVRTLKNAIESNRIAHAFMLTGVRGVGKTTTARIIARALNYTGPDGSAGPTTGPTDDCAVCRSIAEGRHPDVLEMDAASRTGVDDIREIIDGVRYAPTSARYKIYIIDEVHMLSKGAFNALLKTLEEPPPHVKFIFATTEIGKVPVTVLSRCQRFDLRRVDIPVLEAHYSKICDLEQVQASPEAIRMIARAADGSVRDGLSLLDQAMALGVGGTISAEQVKDMLGLADRGRVLDLLEHALRGEAAQALDVLGDLHDLGANPVTVFEDMLDLVHVMTRLRVAPATVDMADGLSPDAAARALDLSGRMSMPTLGRAWQILLKGLSELHTAPNPQAAAEMVLIRLIYAADLPDPADLLRRLKDEKSAGGAGAAHQASPESAPTPEPVASLRVVGGGTVVAAPQAQPVHDAVALDDLQAIVALLEQNREVMWASQVRQYVRPVHIEQGRIEIQLEAGAHPRLSQELGPVLGRITGGQRWFVTINSAAKAGPTLATLERAALDHALDGARNHRIVAEVLKAFPGATLDLQPVTKD